MKTAQSARQVSNGVTKEQQARLRLIRDERWSRTQKHRLLSLFDSVEEIYLRPDLAQKQVRSKPGKPLTDNYSVQQIALDQNWLQNHNHHLVWINDDAYPSLLRQIDDPPIALFAMGNITLLKEIKVAVIGSRRPTPAGKKIAQRLASGLAELGIAITSGMALGIDGVAHQAALDSESPTIAVMGCGLDIVYPNRHRAMFKQIASRALILSEYPLGSPPTRHSFPQRNRIISGLSHGTVIIEAAARSGSLITARLAMEQNREVMVVPGSPLNPLYIGSNNLIRDGAALVSNVEDVLQVMSISLQSALTQKAKRDPQCNPEMPNSSLLDYIDFESTTLDKIILDSGLTAAEVSSMLLMLELEGVVAATIEGGYARLA